ncbi:MULTISPECIES: hypothetical protein [Meiothermus]|uniref:Uncharacterized protein n=1 Tax=Meiothermus ruber (strain ATCC 35948 / DSM 1279 / VKM B-1258 / 21) TaxID=504728 RepID=D3PN97_MEIRD|nr:hypothetical protein [Meiothermus ruber]ADD29424.1 hypothetical protein Mrub_2675 [Meiothermus ruber DSM 1279]AGK05127.1 hypothetical protein K649_09170 [Meiothermus ruber DSM 1279]MCL6529367.1 hypothetical protein [Meiothermus ruber]GAO76343.1 putative uncharacterized protein [Meiothermus ruber H328]
MEAIKLVGLLLLLVSAVEVALWRVLAPRNPNLNKAFPILMASAVGTAVLGLLLFVLG